MSDGIVWIAAGLVGMGLELAVPGAFLLWLGLAGVGTGVLSRLMVLGFDAQVIVFASLTAIGIGAALALRRKTRPSAVNAPGSGLVGRQATAHRFVAGEGRVRVGDSDWPARLRPNEADPPEAALLDVVGIDGMVLIVKPRD